MTEGNPHEQVTVTDKRRIDPETGEVRHVPPGEPPGGVPEGQAPAAHNADKVAELTADLQRVQADFANYRKRALRDQQAAADRAKAGVVSQLLHVLDDLDRARKHGDLDSGPLKSVADKLDSALNALGLRAFGAEGEDFDPVLHEAVQHEGDGAEGSKPVIGTVMRRGYQLGEQVLRHALVAVVDTVADEASEPAQTPDQADAVEGDAETEQADTSDNADASDQ
ncbi:nucleotide exchange factor GrpE [Mycobacterium lacus]|uniref:Protein GrpE n=1 Tax=Mycobacterium lacus TaxID=169765 RepID=A0A1X1Y5S9_9MYCO|nr:nucleotide exchange factor GrpE [Mycobacterium lacus]MCV7121969.1 nucleotide exchange factor GrpE [Mycobacterium lacus]ORW06361.1 molecular chaperone GrpE [Mycobacterium lacus]BBX98533.1 protein GrpE [Mycobacterium lacus]